MTDTCKNTSLSYYQHTLAGSFTCVGRGLHSGSPVVMTLTPGEPNTGYVFVRTDVTDRKPEIAARWFTVTDTTLSTTISNNMGVKVSTIEHLMAALHASGIDNARIELNASEVPIMDGSAQAFMAIIKAIGSRQQSAERWAIVIKEEISITESGSSVSLTPAAESWMNMEIDFKASVIGKQKLSLPLNSHIFEHQVAKARTFGFEDEILNLQDQGLALGGSIRSAIVIGNNEVLNEEGLHYKDEFVRHKMLDAVGDLALAGARIIGQFNGRCSGHRMNNLLLRTLMTSENSRSYMTIQAAEQYWGMKEERKVANG